MGKGNAVPDDLQKLQQLILTTALTGRWYKFYRWKQRSES